MPWAVFVFGWPAVILAVIAFCLAFQSNRPRLAFVGAAIATPFCLLVGGYGFPFNLGGPIGLAAIYGSSALLASGRRQLAMLALAPFIVVAFVIARPVLRQWGYLP